MRPLAWILCAALLAPACGHAPSRYVVVFGQSNAVLIGDAAAWERGVYVQASDGTGLGPPALDWDAATDPHGWVADVAAHVASSRASRVVLVWAQGEYDAKHSMQQADYLARETALFAKLKRLSGRQDLTFVSVQLYNIRPEAAPIRAAKVEHAAHDPRVVLISGDDLPRADALHYTPAAAAVLWHRALDAGQRPHPGR